MAIMRVGTATQALQVVPFFADLSREQIDELARSLVIRRFAANQTIFHLGDPGGLLYVINYGKVKINHTTREGREIMLAILGQGDFFGELALIDEAPRSATAVALEPTETWTLHRDEFIRYLQDNPEFALHVLKTLAGHIRRLNVQLADIFFLDLPGRLARTLLNLAGQYGRHTVDGTLIELSLTQTDMAEMTGATRVSINKALGRFRRSGWVQVSGRRVTILDHKALEGLIAVSEGEN
ncbi:MAG: Crp/Fnr family transcriptional regulator [Anaerolineae bacterium]|nr:Crp/Fnr family transcriptional regulator [Anaerolineae bacterium]HNS39753.1 Crp/Fnr family transcriptional regulator [Promineifilum sp.]